MNTFILALLLILQHRSDLQLMQKYDGSLLTIRLAMPSFASGCQGKDPGDTFECYCGTGSNHMKDGTSVYNECREGIMNGAFHGIDKVTLKSTYPVGMAVYSPHSRQLCGERDTKQCVCTCFSQEAVDGAADFRTSIVSSFEDGGEKQIRGYITDCLGLCGPNCKQGKNGKRYASILVHDVCQSFIKSTDAMPNKNYCSDEGWNALMAAVFSIIWNGPCPR